MKNVLRRVCVCLALTVIFSNLAFVCNAESVDPAKASSLTIRYKCNEEYYPGLEINVYRVADVFADGTYSLCGKFAELPVNIYGINSNDEWKNVASTLAGYVAADKITADLTGVTNNEGYVSFEEILPGMYLTLSVTHKTEEKITRFEDFLTVLPYTNGDSFDYDISVYPKCESYVPTPEDVEYKVVKFWKESTVNNDRPSEITVDIIKNGEVFETQKLSGENDWSYSWTAPDDGSVWQVAEREVPKDYTVSVICDKGTFIVTNIYSYGDDKAPQTGVMSYDRHYSIALAVAGGALVIFAAFRRKREV